MINKKAYKKTNGQLATKFQYYELSILVLISYLVYKYNPHL